MSDDHVLDAQVRLARASDAWLAADETTAKVRAVYADAFDEVMRLRGSDARFDRSTLTGANVTDDYPEVCTTDGCENDARGEQAICDRCRELLAKRPGCEHDTRVSTRGKFSRSYWSGCTVCGVPSGEVDNPTPPSSAGSV